MVNCPICNFEILNELLKWKNYYKIYKCNKCNLIFSFPLPTDKELFDYYQGFSDEPDYWRNPLVINPFIIEKKKELIKLFDITRKDIKGKKFLDHGGGTGFAYQAAKELGFDAYFLDIDERAINFVKNLFNIEENRIIRDNNDLKYNKFDFIFSDNVIEHVKHPINFIENLFDLLSPNGTLLIKTPNGRNTELIFYPIIIIKGYLMNALKYNSIKKSILAFLSRFWTCDPPRHIYSFSKQNLMVIASVLNINNYEISYYEIPLLKYTSKYLRILLTMSNSFKGMIFKLFLLPIVIIELIPKIIQVLMKKLNLISLGGIVFKLHK